MHSQEEPSKLTQSFNPSVHEQPPTPEQPLVPDLEQGPATAPLVHDTLVDSKEVSNLVEPPPIFEEPLLFERYKPIGSPLPGGMGKVYKVRDTTLGHIVALKTMQSRLLGQPSEVERFKREARAVAQLRHDNIITIHHFDVLLTYMEVFGFIVERILVIRDCFQRVEAVGNVKDLFHAPAAVRAGHLNVGEISALFTQKRKA